MGGGALGHTHTHLRVHDTRAVGRKSGLFFRVTWWRISEGGPMHGWGSEY